MNDLFLNSITDPTQITKKATRDGYGEALVELGGKNQDVFVLTADLADSMKCGVFAKQHPSRFIECGVAEQNMMGIAAGLALSGKIPFVSSFGVFSPGRNWDQLRVSVCYSKANVKIVGGHTGLATGPDGATHQALEDIAITRVLPNLTVIVPVDANQTKQAAIAAAQTPDPTYIRISRESTPLLTTPQTPFTIGKAQVWHQGDDITLIASGPLMYEALLAREMLGNMQISCEVINLHTVKQLDSETIVKSAKKTKHVITIEDHQIMGGMGSAVAEYLCRVFPVPMEFIGVHDSFGQSGSPRELYEHYEMNATSIVKAAQKLLHATGLLESRGL